MTFVTEVLRKILGAKDYSQQIGNEYFMVCLNLGRRMALSLQHFTKMCHTEALGSQQSILLQL